MAHDAAFLAEGLAFVDPPSLSLHEGIGELVVITGNGEAGDIVGRSGPQERDVSETCWCELRATWMEAVLSVLGP